MKKLLLLFTFVFFLLPFSLSQEYDWIDISENIPGDSSDYCLCDIYFISDDEGWISNAWLPEIYHTTDGGLTFEIQTTQLPTTAIHMQNENEGYAGGYSGFIYRTTDGGTNWNFHGTIGATVTDISFPPSGGTGYASGLNGAISSITASAVIPMNSGVNETLTSISFPINSVEGWVCGGSLLNHYINGAWIQDQIRPYAGYNAIYMVDNQNGWAGGDDGIIIHTTDGINWFEQTNPDTSTFRTLQRVFFLNDQEGWAVGTASILHTTNGGIEWTVETEGITGNSLSGLHFTSPINGYVGGQHKTLLKYTQVSGIGDYYETLAFEIFPNPAASVVSIQSVVFSQESATIEITDMQGRKLFEKQTPAGAEEIKIDVSNLASGVYFCRLITEKANATKKLIIK